MLTFGSLFAGIGGLDLGLERAGMACKWQVEIDSYCNKVLQKHWPDVRRYGDVRECGKHNLEPVDLIAGGFPCQDVSVAGRRKGLAGSRSGLWFEFHRVLAELRPGWVIIENVPGLLSSHQGRDFALILRGLAELGYLSAWRILDAQYFGVAQRRRRVFIVGHLGDGCAAEVLFEPACGPRDTPPSREAGAKPAYALAASVRGTGNGQGQGWNSNYVIGFDKSRGTVSGDVAAPLRCNSGRSPGINDGKADNQCIAFVGMAQSGAGWAPPSCPTSEGVALPLDTKRAQAVAYALSTRPGQRLDAEDTYIYQCRGSNIGPLGTLRKGGGGVTSGVPFLAAPTQYGVRRLMPIECERLQGCPDNWTTDQSDSRRYKQLGNAISVPVPEWIGRRIVAASG